MEKAYHQHIDALRAIAVLSVIIFHLDHDYLPGGFIGVDIFFVISGFLISSQLYRDLTNGTFSLKNFYARRIRRILPAAFSVIFLTLVLAQTFFLSDDIKNVAESALWSSFSLANVYFWKFQDYGYFASASETLPLLHYWSLGVEEQFYIFWPIVLILVFTRLRKWIFIGLLTTTIFLSIIIAETLIGSHHSFVYYMLPSRAGELLIGALLAALLHHQLLPTLTAKVAQLIFVSSVLGLFLSVAFIRPDMVFPGWLYLWPTVCAAGFIWAGIYQSNPLMSVISHPYLIWVGKVSFSAYLVHWPILAFYRYGYGEPTIFIQLGLLFIIFFGAWANWTFVEEKFRYTNSGFSRLIFRQLFLPLCFIGVLCVGFIYTNGQGLRVLSPTFLDHVNRLENNAQAPNQYDYVCQYWRLEASHLADENCVIGATSEPKVLLWGDSNAAHYIGLLGSIAQAQGWSFRNATHAACPPIFSDISTYVSGKRRADCQASIRVIKEHLNAYQVIIISADFSRYELKNPDFLSAFYATVSALTEDGKSVILVGKAPVFKNFDRDCGAKSLLYPTSTCSVTLLDSTAKVEEINRMLRQFSSSRHQVTYVDFNAVLCRPQCSPFNDEKPVYFDASHIEIMASWELGRLLLDNELEAAERIYAAIANTL